MGTCRRNVTPSARPRSADQSVSSEDVAACLMRRARSASNDLRRELERDSNDDKINSLLPAERRLKPNSRRICDRRSDVNCRY
jgi:hypothetical protein